MKKTWMLVGNLKKDPLRSTKMKFCGLKFFSSLRGINSYIYYLLSYFFQLNTLNGTARAPLKLNTERSTKTRFPTP